MNRRSDRGDTLVEITLALAITAIGVVGVMSGLGTTAKNSRVNRDQANVEAALRQAAEDVSRQTYVNCATASSYSVGTSNGVTPAISSVRYWDSTFGGGTFVSTCTSDPGVQLIVITASITAVAPQVSQYVEVVKRQP